MAFRFVQVQKLPHLPVKSRIQPGQTVGKIFMYGRL